MDKKSGLNIMLSSVLGSSLNNFGRIIETYIKKTNNLDQSNNKNHGKINSIKSGIPFYSKIEEDSAASSFEELKRLQKGEVIYLQLKHRNSWDIKAVAVYSSRGKRCGYLKQELAHEVALLFAQKWHYLAYIADNYGSNHDALLELVFFSSLREKEVYYGTKESKAAKEHPESKEHSWQPRQKDKQLFLAITKEDYQLVKSLLDKGADPNAKDVERNSPLYYAIKQKNYQLVRLLIEYGADFNKNHCPELALMNGMYMFIIDLISNTAEDKTAENNIIESGIPFYGWISRIDFPERREKARQLKVGETLFLERDYNAFDINAVAVYSNLGQIGYLETNLARNVASLLEQKWYHLVEVSEITACCDIKIKLVVFATIQEKERYLNRDKKKDEYSSLVKTPPMQLLQAISEEDYKLAKDLLNQGEDPNQSDGEGKTPLHYAIARKDDPLIKLLVEHGADPYMKDDSGSTALDLARRKGPSWFVLKFAVAAVKNSSLYTLGSIESGVPIYTRIVGVTFNNRQEKVKRLNNGENLYLIRERDNIHDPNAVAVHSEKGQLGFLEKELAKEVAPVLDQGWDYLARVMFTSGGNGYSFGAQIKLVFFATAQEKKKYLHTNF